MRTVNLYEVPWHLDNPKAERTLGKLHEEGKIELTITVCPSYVAELYRMPFASTDGWGRYFGLQGIETLLQKLAAEEGDNNDVDER